MSGSKRAVKEIQSMSDSLVDAMSTMREEEALAIAKALLDEGKDPLKILDDCSKAMEIVGKRFEEGTFHAPKAKYQTNPNDQNSKFKTSKSALKQ